MDTRKISSLLAGFIVMLFMTTCKSQIAQEKTQDSMEVENETIQASQNNFSFDLFKNILASDSEKVNRLLSPQSIFMDLAMLYNGAHGTTQSAMQKALRLDKINPERLNQSQAELLKNIPNLDDEVSFVMANAIWHRNDLLPKSEFLTINQTFYDAEIHAADFKNPQTVEAINNWVNTKTSGKIPTLIESISPGEVLFLLNAIYFKASWTHSFNPNLTRVMEFHTANGTIETDFMFKDTRFNYLENENLQMIELPYGKGDFSMFVLLPSKNQSVPDLTNSLNHQKFSEMLSAMETTSVKLYLPKWEVSYSADNLIENLSDLGMQVAFENKADFSGLFKSEATKISQVKHKAYIKVDEEGTEAAAATGIGMVTTSLPIPSNIEMKVDRPFVYLIMEKNSGTILFLGTIDNPAID